MTLVVGVEAFSVPAASAAPAASTSSDVQVQPTSLGTGEYPPLGVPVQTESTTSSCQGMQIGSLCEPDNNAPTGSVNMVVLNGTIQTSTGTLSSPEVLGNYPGVQLWSCSGSSCSSPLETAIQNHVSSGDMILINQPNNYGSVCPSSNYQQAPACPLPTTQILGVLSDIAPNLKWTAGSADVLYQPWSLIATKSTDCINGFCTDALNENQTQGRPAGGADLPAGDLSGLLQADQNQNLVYTSSDFVPFDTLDPSAPAGTDEMTFDGKVIDSVTPPTGDPQSGFMVAVLNRDDLSLVSHSNFVTDDKNTPQNGLVGQEFMVAALALYTTNSNDLVAIQSFGTPAPISVEVSCTSTGCSEVYGTSCAGASNCGVYPQDPTWGKLGEEIHELGGTMSEFDALNDGLTTALYNNFNCSNLTPTTCAPVVSKAGYESQPQQVCGGYAFLGGAQVPNSYEIFGSQVETVTGNCPAISGPPAQLQGVLTRDPGSSQFEPFLASALIGGTSATSALDASVFTQVYPAPGTAVTPFPIYSSGQADAFTHIVDAINKNGGTRVNPDLRSSYWQDTKPGDWTTNINRVSAFSCNSVPKSDKCGPVRNEVLKEMKDVRKVYSVFASTTGVFYRSILGAALGGNAESTLSVLQNALIQETQKPATNSIVIEALSIASSAFSAGASVASVLGPEGAAAGAGLGVISAALGIAGTIVSAESQASGSGFEGEIDTTAGQLQTTIDGAFQGMEANLLDVGEMFTTSLSALKYMSGLVTKGAFTHSSSQDLNNAANAIKQTMDQTIYGALMKFVYGVGVGYDATNGIAVPGTVPVGQPLPDPVPEGCFGTHGKGMDEGDFGTAEVPTSGPVLDSPFDSNTNGAPPSATLTTLQPEAFVFLVSAGGNVCGTTGTEGSSWEWGAKALFGPRSQTVTLPGGAKIPDAGFSYAGFLEHGLTNCYVKDNNNSFVLPCGSGEGWPQFGTGAW
jgi:hypothetical protein